MNEAEELKQAFIEKWSSKHWLPTEAVSFISDLGQYAQQVSRGILNEFQNQKFFHALPPAAKDEFYEWINQEDKQ